MKKENFNKFYKFCVDMLVTQKETWQKRKVVSNLIMKVPENEVCS